MTKYCCRTWKVTAEDTELVWWHNTYIIDSPLTPGSQAWFDAVYSLVQAERHIHLPHVQFLRIDCGVVDDQGEMHTAPGFWTIRAEGNGIRDTEGHTGREDSRYALQMIKLLTQGDNGHQVYRHVFYDGEVQGKGTKAIYWNASPLWIHYHWKWFRGHMEDERINQYVIDSFPGSGAVRAYTEVYDWAVGTATKLETLRDAQARKRQAGINARALTLGAAQDASYAWWSLQDAMIAHQEDVPNDLVTPRQNMIGVAINTYKPVLKYFTDFQAPISNSTRWQQPRADPKRDKAKQALTDWALLKDEFTELMERKEVDAATDKVARHWVEDMQKLAQDCCAWCNVVLYSRFT